MQLPLNVPDCYYSMVYRFRANNHTVGYAIVFKCTLHPKTNYLYMMNTVSNTLYVLRLISQEADEDDRICTVLP